MKFPVCHTFIHEIHLRHLAGFDGVNDVDVWLHGVVGGMARPLHDDRRSDATREGVDDESAAAGMGSDKLIAMSEGIVKQTVKKLKLYGSFVISCARSL